MNGGGRILKGANKYIACDSCRNDIYLDENDKIVGYNLSVDHDYTIYSAQPTYSDTDKYDRYTALYKGLEQIYKIDAEFIPIEWNDDIKSTISKIINKLLNRVILK